MLPGSSKYKFLEMSIDGVPSDVPESAYIVRPTTSLNSENSPSFEISNCERGARRYARTASFVACRTAAPFKHPTVVRVECHL